MEHRTASITNMIDLEKEFLNKGEIQELEDDKDTLPLTEKVLLENMVTGQAIDEDE